MPIRLGAITSSAAKWNAIGNKAVVIIAAGAAKDHHAVEQPGIS